MHPAIRSAVFLSVGIVLSLTIAACGGSSPTPTLEPPSPPHNPFPAATAGGSAAFITDGSDFDAGSVTPNLSTYLRDPSTTYCYTWAASGRILTQVAASGSPAACPA